MKKSETNLIQTKKSPVNLLLKLFMVVFLLLSQISVSAQQKNISGTVLGEDKAPLPGVSVSVKGTTLGTLTDNNGKFSLPVPEADFFHGLKAAQGRLFFALAVRRLAGQ